MTDQRNHYSTLNILNNLQSDTRFIYSVLATEYPELHENLQKLFDIEDTFKSLEDTITLLATKAI